MSTQPFLDGSRGRLLAGFHVLLLAAVMVACGGESEDSAVAGVCAGDSDCPGGVCVDGGCADASAADDDGDVFGDLKDGATVFPECTLDPEDYPGEENRDCEDALGEEGCWKCTGDGDVMECIVGLDLQSDVNNCGSCGNACLDGEVCIDGACQCPSGAVLCGCECAAPNQCGGCTDLGGAAGTLNEPCGRCNTGRLTCVGADSIGCAGETSGEDDPLACGPPGVCNVCDIAIGEICYEAECRCPPGQAIIDGLCDVIRPATLLTVGAIATGPNLARFTGEITDIGAPRPNQHGICYGPDAADFDPEAGTNCHNLGSTDTEGTFHLNGVDTNQAMFASGAVYFRAFAINGDEVAMADNVLFVERATVATASTVVTGTTSATYRGVLNGLGTPNPSSVGFCVSTSNTDPRHGASGTTCFDLGPRSSVGDFSMPAEGLSPGTTYHVRAFATNAAGTAYAAGVDSFTAWRLPQVRIPSPPGHVGNLTQTSVRLFASILEVGVPNITQHGFCYSATSATPSESDTCVNLGPRSSTGSFFDDLSGLVPGQTYNVRAYAQNEAGRVWSATRQWRQHLPPAVSLSSTAFSSIGEDRFTVTMNVSEVGHTPITAHGFCYTDNASHRPPEQGPFATCTNLGSLSSAGNRQQTITGLSAGRTYYVRAYATNVTGTVYSVERQVVTLQRPTVITNAVTNRALTQARLNGRVSQRGNPTPISAHGFCVSSTHSIPSLSTANTVCTPSLGSNTGSTAFNFNQLRASLTAGTTYFVRAFATNAAGTNYGNTVTFQTLLHPTVATQPNVTRTPTQATVGGTLTNPGVDAPATYGFCYGTSSNPTSPCVTVGSSSNFFQSFTATITVPTGAAWYARAFAQNSTGVRQYGASVFLGTCEPTDQPDGQDRNCDGIDGDRSQAIFVRPGFGNGGTCGLTPATACGRVSHAVNRAQATGRSQVLVATGTYTDANRINLVANVGIHGGYGPDFTTRDMGNSGRPDITVNNYLAVRGLNNLGQVAIDRMVIRARAGITSGSQRERSSVGMVLHNVGSGVALFNTEIRAQGGAHGNAGAVGAGGWGGWNGGNASNRNGGGGASNYSSGGGGGRGGGGASSGNNGTNGQFASGTSGTGGSGGSSGGCCGSGGQGGDGRNGGSGTQGGHGAAGANLGTVDTFGYNVASGNAGNRGRAGGAGGGGGGGGGR
ncbi:MAG: hypothetical protein EA398_11540, partial [Deltaproteobacteria bacterium]